MLTFSKTVKSHNLAVVSGDRIVGRFEVTAATMGRRFPSKDGKFIIGPNVRRLLTIGQIVGRGIAPSRNKAGDMLRNNDAACTEPLVPELAQAA